MIVKVTFGGFTWKFDKLGEAEAFALTLAAHSVESYNFPAKVEFTDIDDIKKTIIYERCDYDDTEDEGNAGCDSDKEAAEQGETV